MRGSNGPYMPPEWRDDHAVAIAAAPPRKKSQHAKKRWTIDETKQLQHELEVLGMTLSEAAKLHGRSPQSIRIEAATHGFARKAGNK